MNKYEDLDLDSSLVKIAQYHRIKHRGGFDAARSALRKAVDSPAAEDKVLLWLPHSRGIFCFRERDVFLAGSSPYRTWQHYGMQARLRPYVYTVEVKGSLYGGSPWGDLYQLDFQKYFKHVKETALPADYVMLVYERGCRLQPAAQYLPIEKNPQLGKFLYLEAQPNDPYRLLYTLWEEKAMRGRNASVP